MSNSVRPHSRQTTRLRHPWDSPGKNTGVGLAQSLGVTSCLPTGGALKGAGLEAFRSRLGGRCPCEKGVGPEVGVVVLDGAQSSWRGGDRWKNALLKGGLLGLPRRIWEDVGTQVKSGIA